MSSKSLFYAAVVAAILSSGITISGECLAIIKTGEFIYGFSLHLVHMAVPPLHAAAIRAESFLLSTRILLDKHSTLLTAKLRTSFSIKGLGTFKSMPPAIGLYTVNRDAQHPGNLGIAKSLVTILLYLSLLFISHIIVLLNRFKVSPPTSLRTVGWRLTGWTHKKSLQAIR